MTHIRPKEGASMSRVDGCPLHWYTRIHHIYTTPYPGCVDNSFDDYSPENDCRETSERMEQGRPDVYDFDIGLVQLCC